MNPEELQHLRHSLAHLLAAAVLEIHPDAKRTIGPAIDDGFYYDFEHADGFVEEDLQKIETRMKELVAQNINYEPSIISKEEAIEYFTRRGEHLKVELIQEKAGEKLGRTVTVDVEVEPALIGGLAGAAVTPA